MKENHHQESQIKESQSCASISTLISEETKIPKPAFSRLVDDDEKLREAAEYGSPWEELHANYRMASKGKQMSYQDECWLKEEMELRGIAPQALVDLVRKNPLPGFKKPMAGLKWLVKKFRIKTRSGPELHADCTAPAFSQRTENSRCEKCGNTGLVLERIEGQRPRATDQYCDCGMGKEVEAVERRKQMALLHGQRPWSAREVPSESGDRRVAN